MACIEAGAAFRSIFERHDGAEIGEVRRQREDWQRDATRDLATGCTGEAIHAYDTHGMVHAAPTREQARDDLINRWDCDRKASPLAARHAVSVKAIEGLPLLASVHHIPARGQHQGQQIHAIGRHPKMQIETAEGVNLHKYQIISTPYGMA